MQYTIRQANAKPTRSAADGSGLVWSEVESVSVNNFRPESSGHRPQTLAQLLYDSQGLHGRFQVEDRYVRCVRTEYGSEVWKDSCVEFFVEPKPGRGYFNFEFNSGGAFLVNHIVDPTRTADGFKEFVRIPESVARAVRCGPRFRLSVNRKLSKLSRGRWHFSSRSSSWNHMSERWEPSPVRSGAEIFTNVRKTIRTRTGRRGRPWTNSTFTGPTASGNYNSFENKTPAAGR